MATYLLLDGHSLAFRAWFALKDADMTSASGQSTAAVYGFVGMLTRLLEDHSPAGMAVAFDRTEPTFRDAIADDYKAGRPETPEPLREQLEIIRRLVETMGVPVVDAVGYEADDVIATLADLLERAGEDVIVVTGDRDAYQLVHDPHVRVLYNRRGVTDYVLYDEAGIKERTGVSPELYPMLASLRGDPSDNLPGVPGVGEKTAAKLVNTYGDLDSLFAHTEELTPKLRASLDASEARVRQNFALTPLVRNVPLELNLDELRFGGSDRPAMDGLFNLLEIRGPRARIAKALDRLEGARAPAGAEASVASADATGGPAGSGGPGPPRLAAVPAAKVLELDDARAAVGFLGALRAGGGLVAVEPEWAGTPGRSEIVGLAWCRVPPAEPAADASSGREPAAELGWLPGHLLLEGEVARAVGAVLGRGGMPAHDGPDDGAGRNEQSTAGAQAGEARTRPGVVAHRAKELMRGLAPMGIGLDGLSLDVAVAGYLADPGIGQASLERLADVAGELGRAGGPGSLGAGAERGGGTGRGITEQLGFDLAGKRDGEGAESAGARADSAARRVVLIATLEKPLRRALVDAGAERLYEDIEQPLIHVLAKMEVAGIAVDVERLAAIGRDMAEQVAALEAEVQLLAGEPFNVNSTPQLRHILFEKLGLATQKRTKTGYSTDAQSLAKLRGTHEIIGALLAFREVEKLRSTYGTGLLSEVALDGRIHASFNQTVARTGRLSSDQPNLHNIPVRSALGRRFREVFIPGPRAELLVADYDQIELRVIAHLAQDPGLIEAFRTGVDIHAATAARVFGVEPSEVTAAQRSKAKMISYGLAYGMEAYGLAQRLAVPVDEAAAILAQYFSAFPKVKEYMSRTVTEARLRGYTETLFGRRRYLPELDSPNFRVRQAAERQAMNAGIQGLAADIFKVALVRLDAELVGRSLRSRVVLQVHDEILVESMLEEADEVSEVTVRVMQGACDLSVPLAVHAARGTSWAQAKELGSSGVTDKDLEADATDELEFGVALEH
ncbi:MAG: DNA polymerase I [Acidimicrobiales bacterium]